MPLNAFKVSQWMILVPPNAFKINLWMMNTTRGFLIMKILRREKNNIVEEWQSTLLSRMDCLSQAEMSLRNSGFYRKITLLDDSIFGKNANNYQGLIKCIHSNSQVYFQVKGKNAHTLEQLLDKLQLNF
ncbi:hypothetical protein BGP_4105 [Beggiatoa sp. PS]|nr:hypothetical protein BGP_4105 [Beggiatoa sp. PS]